MNYWPSVLLFICLTSITNIAGNQQRKRNSIEDYQWNKKYSRDPRRGVYNATGTLTSAKIGSRTPKDNTVSGHPALRVEQFETRLDHFSTDDQRTVEFVRK